tara:strand:- start:44040 stop:46244 length:2205 start_codon:yes stop_codon:yes gene_type:complete
MSFREIKFPDDLEYSSDGETVPLEFYLDILPASKVIHLKLGYFSSKAIQVLAYGFAQFIHNGGNLKIITNHFLYKDDQALIDTTNRHSKEIAEPRFLSDIEWLAEKLSSEMFHLLDCLKYLVRMGRLEIIPVMLFPGRMVHYKQGIFTDEVENEILMDGSCNFTANGLLENAETITISRSWGSDVEQKKIQSKRDNIESIIDRKSTKYEYLEPDRILDAVSSIGRDKDIAELLEDELDLLRTQGADQLSRILEKHKNVLELKIKTIRETPRFPYPEGPREYQSEAYRRWVESNKQGIFAMATGTGKTITSINCLLNEYLEEKVYRAIILVPSKALLDQWYEEIRKFNFRNIYRVSSDYNWMPDLDILNTGLSFDENQSFIVISTYQTFVSEKFQKKITKFPESTLLIADEAHNIGSLKMKSLLPNLHFKKRIALSATPQRRFDEEGNELIEEFFNSKEPYTYSFSMEKAIKENILCQYEYYPHKVYLSEEEMDAYVEISRKLQRMFDNETNTFRNMEVAKMLLLERRKIIHKAKKKLLVFKEIVCNFVNRRGNFNFSFVYVPEGDDSDGENLLDLYMQVLNDTVPSIKAHHYTSKSENRAEVMKNFEEGFIDSLFSMKCLDEGVDIPRAEIAIFCASTGNPRQFIQRRGRILRQHKDKKFAIIHDLVVLPLPGGENSTFSMEKSLIREELIRVIYFASLSRNYYESMEEFREVADYYDLNLYSLEQTLKESSHG